MAAAVTWTTIDKRVLKVKDMDLEHMRNCIHMVCRSRRVSFRMLSDALQALRYANTAPDGAAMAASDSAMELIDAAYDPTRIEARLPYALQLSPPLKAMLKRLRKAKFDYLTPVPRAPRH